MLDRSVVHRVADAETGPRMQRHTADMGGGDAGGRGDGGGDTAVGEIFDKAIEQVGFAAARSTGQKDVVACCQDFYRGGLLHDGIMKLARKKCD